MKISKLFKTPTLTSLAKTCGWAAKLSPVGLQNLLDKLKQEQNPNVLVGFDTSDDAGIYLINQAQAIVSTVDFITPPVDDPFLFGQIAAANSLSDVYAMGGTPFACLNLLCFPSDNWLRINSNIFSSLP